MSGKTTRREWLAALGAVGIPALAGCSSESPGDDTATTSAGDSGTPTAETEPEGDLPAIVRYTPDAVADSEVELLHLSVPDFLAAESSFSSDIADLIAQDFRQLAGTLDIGFDAVTEGARVSGGATICEGDFTAADATLPPEGDDAEYTTDAYRGYELFVGDQQSFAIRDGAVVFTVGGRDFLEQLIDAGEAPENRLRSRVEGFPSAFDPAELSFGFYSLGAIGLPFTAISSGEVERWGRGWTFGEAQTELSEGVVFTSTEAASPDEIRTAVNEMEYYSQYSDRNVVQEEHVVRISGTVSNGDFVPFPGY